MGRVKLKARAIKQLCNYSLDSWRCVGTLWRSRVLSATQYFKCIAWMPATSTGSGSCSSGMVDKTANEAMRVLSKRTTTTCISSLSSLSLCSKQHIFGLTQECFLESCIVESTASYIFPVQTGGIFYVPWHRHHIEGTNGFLVSHPKNAEIHNL